MSAFLRGVSVACLLILTSLLVRPVGVMAQAGSPDMARYYDQSFFLSAPPASFGDGLFGTANPALARMVGSGTAFIWSSDGTDVGSMQNWGVFSNLGGLSASFTRLNRGPLEVNRYHIGLSGGTRSGAIGIAYQGFGGDATALGRYNRFVAGSVFRPTRYLSVGAVGNLALETDDWEVVGEIGVRPFGTSRLTLFADASMEDGEAIQDALWSAGGAVEIVDGVQLFGRFFENETQTIGLRIDVGRGGVESFSGIDTDGDYSGQVSRIRMGSHQPSALYRAVASGRQRIDLDLSGSLPYRKTRIASFFGSAPPRYYEVLRTIRQAAETGTVRVITLNLSGVKLGTAKAWELRRALQTASDRGITVVAYLENAQMTDYYLASAADVVVQDPRGNMILPGYALSRTYLDGTLDKLGLEFDEWRFFEFKSAAETLSRKEFSEADSTQRAEYLEDVYATVVRGMSNDRDIDRDSLDLLIDEKTILTARDAQSAGLVDSLGRWHDRDQFVDDLLGHGTRMIDAEELDEVATATRAWSEPDKIAVVYGIGPTSMDTGIEARTLHKSIRDLKSRDDVSAVVFRVDSPGGDGMASDLVAQALKEVAAEKPVIVSQGQVAGSGGYWISAYADTILATPTTVTGSIGVIGGWLYADGWSEKTGQTYDVVQEGRRADLFTGYRLPIIGAQIPARPLRTDERERVEELFQSFYTDFVQLVAEGRDTTETHIREVAEGRIYSGIDGKQVGLVDEIGGFLDAIDLARRASGVPADRAEIVEVNPESGFWNLSRVLPFPFRLIARGSGDSETESPAEAFIRTAVENQPAPFVMIPPGLYPVEPR
ncbi:S49 family peptidase [Longibacter salinarum]|nr:S49 family peptidase [Longibacter salinarum]